MVREPFGEFGYRLRIDADEHSTYGLAIIMSPNVSAARLKFPPKTGSSVFVCCPSTVDLRLKPNFLRVLITQNNIHTIR